MSIKIDFIDWDARTAPLNLRPHFWETEKGSKQLQVALKAIATFALTATTVASICFSATVIGLCGLTATAAFIGFKILSRTPRFEKDPLWWQKYGIEALESFEVVGLYYRSYKEWVESYEKKSPWFKQLSEKGILKIEDLKILRQRHLQRAFETTQWRGWFTFQVSNRIDSVDEFSKETAKKVFDKVIDDVIKEYSISQFEWCDDLERYARFFKISKTEILSAIYERDMALKGLDKNYKKQAISEFSENFTYQEFAAKHSVLIPHMQAKDWKKLALPRLKTFFSALSAHFKQFDLFLDKRLLNRLPEDVMKYLRQRYLTFLATEALLENRGDYRDVGERIGLIWEQMQYELEKRRDEYAELDKQWNEKTAEEQKEALDELESKVQRGEKTGEEQSGLTKVISSVWNWWKS